MQAIIVARATPIGSGTLGIIRLSGKSCLTLCDNFSKLLSSKRLALAEGNKIYVGKIADGEQLVDEVTFLVFRSPRSFTGEDVVEIVCHNNNIIIDNIIRLAISFGARMALPGEFSQRAYQNNKIDLVQAEAICEIIRANNQGSLERALSQLKGSLSSFLDDFMSKALKMVALLEASFEFLEEEALDLDIDTVVGDAFSGLLDSVKTLKKCVKNNQRIRSGIRIVFAGSTNVGKSTLFNLLLDKDRAIVSDVAGTTRDVIEAHINDKGALLELVDTAGIRETQDFVESKGISKSWDEIRKADLVLVIVDASKKLPVKEFKSYHQLLVEKQSRTILVLNKIDLGIDTSNSDLRAVAQREVCVSGKDGTNVTILERLIKETVTELTDAGDSPFLLSQRQQLLVGQLVQQLEQIQHMFAEKLPLEVIVVNLKLLIEVGWQFSGKSLSEAVLSEIFGNFCIGK